MPKSNIFLTISSPFLLSPRFISHRPYISFHLPLGIAHSGYGKIGKAIANDTREKAHVAGFAETTVSAGSNVRAIVRGVIATSGLNPGRNYFLSHLSAGAITETPSTTSGHFVVPVGESGTSAQFVIRIEPETLRS